MKRLFAVLCSLFLLLPDAASSGVRSFCHLKVDGSRMNSTKTQVEVYFLEREGVCDIDNAYEEMKNALHQDDPSDNEIVSLLDDYPSSSGCPFVKVASFPLGKDEVRVLPFVVEPVRMVEVPDNDNDNNTVIVPVDALMSVKLDNTFLLNTSPSALPSVELKCADSWDGLDNDNDSTRAVLFTGIQPTGDRRLAVLPEGLAVVPLYPGLPPRDIGEMLNPVLPIQPFDIPEYAGAIIMFDLPAVMGASEHPLVYFSSSTDYENIKPVSVLGKTRQLLRGEKGIFYLEWGDYSRLIKGSYGVYVGDDFRDYHFSFWGRKKAFLDTSYYVSPGGYSPISFFPISWEDPKCIVMCPVVELLRVSTDNPY